MMRFGMFWVLSAVLGCLACARTLAVPGSGLESTQGYLRGAGGARIYFQVLGSGRDTVVAVHGGPGAGMQAILPELAPLGERHTVIFYDQRGGGRSELPADTAALRAQSFVDDLEAVRVHFGLDRMTVIAHSFGSVLVASYAEQHPHRLRRLIFFGAVGPQRAEAQAQAQAAPAQVDTALRRRHFTVVRSLMDGSAPDPLAACREYEALGREMALARGESGRWKGTNCAMPPEALRYYFGRTASLGPQNFGAWDFTTSLRHITAPLLVIYGALDPTAVPAQRSWAGAVPNGRLLLVPGAGKGVSADRPDAFFPAVESFLAGEWPAGAEPPH